MIRALAFALFLTIVFSAVSLASIPDEFPRYIVPGYQRDMNTLRRMYWVHYPGSGPKATLWDAWLAPPALWPDMKPADGDASMQKRWSGALSGRIMDEDGYIATHQHTSITHQLGWPFPFWNQGTGGYGWHFSFKNMVGPPWRQEHLTPAEGLAFQGADNGGLEEDGLLVNLTADNGSLTFDERELNVLECPFIQVRWRAEAGFQTNPVLHWRLKGQDSFPEGQSFELKPVPEVLTWYMAPVYKHPLWKGPIAQLKITFGNEKPGKVWLQGLFTHPDTRHNLNNTAYINGCYQYIVWTGDLAFLEKNIDKMRRALDYAITEFEVEKHKVVWTGWTGHDGRSGIEYKDGKKLIHYGVGVGNNYWDLLPFGGFDMYATMYLYTALRQMAELETFASTLNKMDIASPSSDRSPAKLLHLAETIKKAGNARFFVKETGRFSPAEDVTGKLWDYGLTFINLESIYYGFAEEKQVKAIMSWINGDRIVEGDTSQGKDIYHWRFAPRATTRRNIDYYIYPWSGPESIPWGGQVQDGGAVFGFTFHDLMARHKVLGPDNAWERLQEIIMWYREVMNAGGYRSYYDGKREGSLQGGGTAGGLGIDQEFFESVLATQVMIEGFMGLKANVDSIYLAPSLPREWPELTITNIRYQTGVYTITASDESIKIECLKKPSHPLTIGFKGSRIHQNQTNDRFVVYPEVNTVMEFKKKTK